MFWGAWKKSDTGRRSARWQMYCYILEPIWAEERHLEGEGKVWRRGSTEAAYGQTSKGARFSGSGGQCRRYLSSCLNLTRGLLPGEIHTKDKGLWSTWRWQELHGWSSWGHVEELNVLWRIHDNLTGKPVFGCWATERAPKINLCWKKTSHGERTTPGPGE